MALIVIGETGASWDMG